MADFHPNMLGRQLGPPRQPLRPNTGGGFHPNMLGRQQLAGLGTTAPAPQPSGHELPGGIRLDMSQGIIWIGDSPVKLVPAIISAIAVKLIFFGGSKAASAAKAGVRRLRGHSGEAATNPGKSAKPWQAVAFGPHGKRIAQRRCRTKSSGEAFVERQDGVAYSRVSYVG